ncbi:hypothetical protein [Nostoc punctiforme]|nr:hypothetical protein [Nostoc punctiforme]
MLKKRSHYIPIKLSMIDDERSLKLAQCYDRIRNIASVSANYAT